MLVGLHVPKNFLIYRQTLTLSKCMCMLLSGTSELRNFGIFTFLICYFFQYFVGTSDTLSVQMTCLSAHMYRQISKCTDKFPNVPTKIRKSNIGGGGAAAPPAPPPSGYANDLSTLVGTSNLVRIISSTISLQFSRSPCGASPIPTNLMLFLLDKRSLWLLATSVLAHLGT